MAESSPGSTPQGATEPAVSRRWPRRRRRLWVAGAVAGVVAVVAALVATLVLPPAPRLVWNASASSPLGLYRVMPAYRIRPGEMALAWPPAHARELAAVRRYLPRNVPLVKRAAAAAGDRVCASGSTVLVNGHIAARRRGVDPSGRSMPWWTGCETLRGADLLLLSPGRPDAFDGRYFGVTRGALVLGRARLLWSP